MTEWKTYLEINGKTIPLGSTQTITSLDVTMEKDESVISEWHNKNGAFFFSNILSKKEYAKWMWCFGIKTRIPRKLKKKWKKG